MPLWPLRTRRRSALVDQPRDWVRTRATPWSGPGTGPRPSLLPHLSVPGSSVLHALPVGVSLFKGLTVTFRGTASVTGLHVITPRGACRDSALELASGAEVEGGAGVIWDRDLHGQPSCHQTQAGLGARPGQGAVAQARSSETCVPALWPCGAGVQPPPLPPYST